MRFFLPLLGLAITYGVFAATGLEHYQRTLVHGSSVRIAITFSVILILAYAFRPQSLLDVDGKPYWNILYGAIVGYGAGALAILAEPVLRGAGIATVLRLTGRGWQAAAFPVFVGPIVLLTWLFGGIVGLIVALSITRNLKWSAALLIVVVIAVVLHLIEVLVTGTPAHMR